MCEGYEDCYSGDDEYNCGYIILSLPQTLQSPLIASQVTTVPQVIYTSALMVTVYHTLEDVMDTTIVETALMKIAVVQVYIILYSVNKIILFQQAVQLDL